MRLIRIPKRNGKYRDIMAVTPTERGEYRLMLYDFQLIAEEVCPLLVVHGFWPCRSPVTNALMHCGYTYTISYDLENFFDTVTPKMIAKNAPRMTPKHVQMFNKAFVDGMARQGLPTSPVVANIAAAGMDHQIENYCRSRWIMYTRYADDLTFSFNDNSEAEPLNAIVEQAVNVHGFKLNHSKTYRQSSHGGRRIITGVAVDDTIHPTRAIKRKYRAACHQGHGHQARGLKEWMKLRLPDQFDFEEVRSRNRFAGVIDFEPNS